MQAQSGGSSPSEIIGKLSHQIKRTVTKVENSRRKENRSKNQDYISRHDDDISIFNQPKFDPEVQALEYKALYEKMDPKIMDLDDVLRKKEEVKWKI